jgi:hypothetical protein
MKCVQCGSKWCGPIVCRFSSVRHSDYMRQWNDGVARVKREFEPRPDHDMTCDGLPLKAGR